MTTAAPTPAPIPAVDVLDALPADDFAAAVAAYRGGVSDLTAVLAARRNEIDVRTQTLQLGLDTARIWAQLNFLSPDDAHGSAPDEHATPQDKK